MSNINANDEFVLLMEILFSLYGREFLSYLRTSYIRVLLLNLTSLHVVKEIRAGNPRSTRTTTTKADYNSNHNLGTTTKRTTGTQTNDDNLINQMNIIINLITALVSKSNN